MDITSPAQFGTYAAAVKTAESSANNLFAFCIPAGTIFPRCDYWGTRTTPEGYLMLDAPVRVRLEHLEANRIKVYTHNRRCHRVTKDGERIPQVPDQYGRLPHAYGDSYGYIVFTWEEIFQNETLKAVVSDWIEKVTPDFTVNKEKGVINFVNNKTQEKLYCDLGKQTFERTYKKGKNKFVRYPAQYFKYVSGRLLLDKIADTDCKNFQTLVNLVADNYRKCKNFGTFLVKMFDHQHLEQYIAANVPFDFNIPFNYSDFSKDIRKKLNDCDIRYTQDVGSLFCSDIDTGRAVFAQIKDVKGFKNMVTILAHNIQPLNTLVNHYNYDLKTVFAYCRERNWISGRTNYYYGTRPQVAPVNPETTDNPVSHYQYDIVSYLRDYARMALDVYGENYEKYPANLKEAHDDVSARHRLRAYNVNKEQFDKTIDTSLEWKGKEFVVVYPKTPDEIIAEGIKLRHCVGSYVQSVVRGECKILFLRKKDELETPFVTIEVSGGNIRQARAYGNATPVYDARMELQDYAKAKKLLYRG